MQSNRSSWRRELATYPGMVRWYDPRQLSETGLRDVITRVFGQYADQRIMQATIDGFGQAVLQSVVKRYDYANDPSVRDGDAVWVDYVADLGDGFDSTYAIASLIAADKLKVGEDLELPGGKILLLGGDQVYPFPTRWNYETRFVKPYRDALPGERGPARRRMFALPGNHDWYDGLSSFDNVFCKARFERDEWSTPPQPGRQPRPPKENRIGAWLCPQHRSYWAIRLPHNWWIWGADIQVSQYLDAGQVLYFRAVAEMMESKTEVPKLILCIAEPSWTFDHRNERQGEDNLDLIINIALNHNARICAILAGDTHHYARYRAEDLGIEFITAGGGGAYFSPTHNLRETRTLEFAGLKHTLSLKCKETPDGGKTDSCWPSRRESRWHSLRALLFPARNYGFSMALGFIYWLLAWPFAYTKVDFAGDGKEQNVSAWIFKSGLLRDVTQAKSFSEMLYGIWEIALLTLSAGITNPALGLGALAILLVLVNYAEAPTFAQKLLMGLVHLIAHLAMAVTLYIMLSLLAGAIIGIFQAVVALVAPSWKLSDRTVIYAHDFLFPPLMWFIGGIFAGLVWGAYLMVACLFKRHCDQAFSSLRLTIFRHFVRMKIEPNRLTIYPIGIRTVPSRKRWRMGETDDHGEPKGPRYVPSRDFKPELIDGPIVVDPANVTARDPSRRGIESVAPPFAVAAPPSGGPTI